MGIFKIFPKRSILDVRQNSKYVSAHVCFPGMILHSQFLTESKNLRTTMSLNFGHTAGLAYVT